jgi:pilus assembly protein CpaE
MTAMDTRHPAADTAPAPEQLKVLVIGRDAQRLAAHAQALRDGPGSLLVVTAVGEPDQLLTALGRHAPDILLVDAAAYGEAALVQIERAERLYPELRVLLIAEAQSADFLMSAMRVGVREVLPEGAPAAALVAAVQRVAEKWTQPHGREGRVLAFMSCKGGASGATFLATNIGYALAEMGKRVILLDLNLQWGDATFFISDQKPTSTLTDVAAQIERVDAVLLAASLTHVTPNLGVLAAPEDPAHALDIRPEHVDVLLRLARHNYDFVLLDTGQTLDAVTVRALDYADHIFPVLQVSVPSIRNGKRLLEAFRLLEYPTAKVGLIVNRYERGGPIPLQQLEEAIGVKAHFTFPNDYGPVSESINQGVPVLKLARHSAIARSIRDFAESLTPQHVEGKRGWFGRMLKRA